MWPPQCQTEAPFPPKWERRLCLEVQNSECCCAVSTITPTSCPRDTVNCDYKEKSEYSLSLSKRIIICSDSAWCSLQRWTPAREAGWQSRGQRKISLFTGLPGLHSKSRRCLLWPLSPAEMMEITEPQDDWGVRDLWRLPCPTPCSNTWWVKLTHGWKNHCHFSQHCSHCRETSPVTTLSFINGNNLSFTNKGEQEGKDGTFPTTLQGLCATATQWTGARCQSHFQQGQILCSVLEWISCWDIEVAQLEMSSAFYSLMAIDIHSVLHEIQLLFALSKHGYFPAKVSTTSAPGCVITCQTLQVQRSLFVLLQFKGKPLSALVIFAHPAPVPQSSGCSQCKQEEVTSLSVPAEAAPSAASWSLKGHWWPHGFFPIHILIFWGKQWVLPCSYEVFL